MEEERFNIIEVLKAGWQKFLENPAFLLVAFWGTYAFDMIPLAFKTIFIWFKNPYVITIYLILKVVCFLVSPIFTIGLFKIYLKLAYGEKADYSDLVKHFRFYFRFIGEFILYMLILGAGLILLIIPGIIWSIQYSFAGFFVVDKGMRPIEALKASSKLTKGAKWDLLALSIMISLINLAGLLCCCVGIFVAMPVCAVANAFVYRRLLETQDGAGMPPIVPVEPSPVPPAAPENF